MDSASTSTIPGAVAPTLFMSMTFLTSILLKAFSDSDYYKDYFNLKSKHERNQCHGPEIFDFIIVGGGSAGSVLANRLSKHNSVLLLEIGGNPNPISDIPITTFGNLCDPSVNLLYETIPQKRAAKALKRNVVLWPRGKHLGGSSNTNGMVYIRGNPKDYDNWANLTGNNEWSSKNMLKYFKKSEDYNGMYTNSEFYGKGGPLHVETIHQSYMAKQYLDAAHEKGYRIGDINAYDQNGFSEIETTTKGGFRWSTYSGYLKPILNRSTLTIYRYSRVVKIHLDYKKHAIGVTYIRHGVQKFVKARREIILSAGAIDSPKILMLSGIGPKKHLDSVGIKCQVQLPVGQHLQDHVVQLIGPFLVNTSKNAETGNQSLMFERVLSLKTLQETFQQKGPVVSSGLSATGFICTSLSSDKSWPDIQFILLAFGLTNGLDDAFENLFNIRKNISTKYFGEFDGSDANFVLNILVRPKSRGYIQLAGKDPMLNPIIDPNYLENDDDLHALIEGFKVTIDMFEHTKAYEDVDAQLVPGPFPDCTTEEFNSEAYHKCLVQHMTMTLYHPTGTARMGSYLTQMTSKNTNAVVDPELRVFHTTGLRVIDASIMPEIVNGNTNAPTIAIAELGSDFIRRYWANHMEVCCKYSRLMGLENTKSFYSKIM